MSRVFLYINPVVIHGASLCWVKNKGLSSAHQLKSCIDIEQNGGPNGLVGWRQ
jgi:hypothetical protein